MRFGFWLAAVIASLISIASPAFAGCAYFISSTGSFRTAGASDDWIIPSYHFLLTSYVTASRPHMRAPLDSVVHDIAVNMQTAPGAGDGWRFSVIADEVEVLSCEISDTATTCTDNTTQGSISRGQEVAIKADSSIGATDPTNPGAVTIGFCMDAA